MRRGRRVGGWLRSGSRREPFPGGAHCDGGGRAAVRVLGTAVFMTAQPTGTLPALAHDLRHNKVLHKRSVVLTVATAQVPHVPNEERLAVQLSDAICSTSASDRLTENPNVPEALEATARAMSQA